MEKCAENTVRVPVREGLLYAGTEFGLFYSNDQGSHWMALTGNLPTVAINDLVDNTFFAQIFVQVNREELIIDSRPSDAIALALRAEVPIYVAEAVLDKAKADDLGARDKEKLKKWLEEVDPDDLGKYTM